MPKGTKVHKCVQKCKRKSKGKKKSNCYAVCQASTGQSYATGKKLNTRKQAYQHALGG